ncbi:hypothetical protein F5Y15DRAFT_410402 [Xylariaceae sp. FL0016]|nr:hypothetical protein F5Y15DRAFT_410402 [Xylariaceae sp. FL0016]
MCYQLTELYSACRCLYYQHAVDRCAAYGRPGHGITKRTILVGYACQDHSQSSGYGAYAGGQTYSDSGYYSNYSTRDSYHRRGSLIFTLPDPDRATSRHPVGPRNCLSFSKATTVSYRVQLLPTSTHAVDRSNQRMPGIHRTHFIGRDAISLISVIEDTKEEEEKHISPSGPTLTQHSSLATTIYCRLFLLNVDYDLTSQTMTENTSLLLFLQISAFDL